MEKEINIDLKMPKNEPEISAKIILDSLAETNKGLRKIIVALIAGWVLTVIAGVGGFVWYESQFETTEQVSEESTVTLSTEGDNANINNVKGNQYNDNATHNEKGAE